jgi:hypothetical protein
VQPERIGPPVRPSNTLDDNIKTDLKDIGWKGMDYFRMSRGGDTRRAVLYSVMNLTVAVQCGDFLDRRGSLSV